MKYSRVGNEPWAELADPVLARKWCVMTMAGIASQRYASGSRQSIAQHEAGHLIAAWRLGFKIGGVAIVTNADNTLSRGLAHVETRLTSGTGGAGVEESLSLTRPKTKFSDTWRVARIIAIHGWGSGWRGILRVVREIFEEAKALIRNKENLWAMYDLARDIERLGALSAEQVRMGIYLALGRGAAWNFGNEVCHAYAD